MVVESPMTIAAPTAVPSSGLDLTTLTAGRIVEARVMALVGQMATLASRHGPLEVDLGANRAAIGDVLRFEVHSVTGEDGQARLQLSLAPSGDETAAGVAKTASAVDPVQQALGRAVARAVTTQSGLAPLYATLAGLATSSASASASGEVPEPIRVLVGQLMGARLAASGPPTAKAVATAFRNSGLFSESQPTPPDGEKGSSDLKTTLIALRSALTRWVGSVPGPGATGGATGSTPASPPPTGRASSGTATGGISTDPATGTGPAATERGVGSSSSSGLAVRAAYGAPTGSVRTPADAGVVGGGAARLAAAAYGGAAVTVRVPSGAVGPTAVVPGSTPTGTGASTTVATPVLASPSQVVPSGVTLPPSTSPEPTIEGASASGERRPGPGAVVSDPTAPLGARVAAPVPPSGGSGSTVAPPSVASSGVSPEASSSRDLPVSPAEGGMRGPAPSATTIPAVASPTPGSVSVGSPVIGTPVPIGQDGDPSVPSGVARGSSPVPGATTVATDPVVPPPPSTVPGGPPGGRARPVDDRTPPTVAPSPTASAALSSPSATAPDRAASPTSPAPTPQSSGDQPIPAPSVSRVAASPEVATVRPDPTGSDGPLDPGWRRGAVADLGLDPSEASESLAGSAQVATRHERGVKGPPPPRKGVPPVAQAALPPEAGSDEDVAVLGRRALERTEGALQRILLEQYVALDTHGDDAHAGSARGQREWTAELPLATSAGTSIVQMTVERDGAGKGGDREARSIGWRLRFALDVEPIGPIHALIGLSGDHLSVGLWIERPEMAERLASDVGQLTSALADGGLTVEPVRVKSGMPPSASAETGSPSGHFIDVSL